MPDNVTGSDAPVTATPTPASSAAPMQTPAAPTATPPATAQAPATGAPGEGWVPSYRLREIKESAAREFQNQRAQDKAEYEAELKRVTSQLHAIVGVTPPGNPEIEQIKEQFGQLYPGLTQLEQRAQDLMGLIEHAGDLEQQTTHYWQTYGRQSMDRLFSAAEKTLGSPLTEEGKRALHSGFVGFVSSSPELTARYAEDPTIVEDYWKMMSSTLIDPVRRTTAAGVQARIPGALPQDVPGGAPVVSQAPKPKDLDERTSMAWQAFQAARTKP
jgi:hypothetical protein